MIRRFLEALNIIKMDKSNKNEKDVGDSVCGCCKGKQVWRDSDGSIILCGECFTN